MFAWLGADTEGHDGLADRTLGAETTSASICCRAGAPSEIFCMRPPYAPLVRLQRAYGPNWGMDRRLHITPAPPSEKPALWLNRMAISAIRQLSSSPMPRKAAGAYRANGSPGPPVDQPGWGTLYPWRVLIME